MKDKIYRGYLIRKAKQMPKAFEIYTSFGAFCEAHATLTAAKGIIDRVHEGTACFMIEPVRS